MPFTWKLHIDAPPEVVFDALADVANHGAWANPNAKLQIHEVSGGPPALGSKYRSEQVFVGKPNTADIEITAFDRPRRFAYSVSQRKDGAQKDVHLTHTFTLTPEGGGTSLQRSTDGDGNPLLGIIAFPAIKADGKKSLGNFKALVEGPAEA